MTDPQHAAHDIARTAARRVLLALALLGGTAQLALAAPTNGELLTNFNGILGGYSTSSESEGALIVGSNFNGFNHSGYVSTPSAASLTGAGGYGALNVYGTASGNANMNGAVVHVTGADTGGNYGSGATYGYTFNYTFNSLFSQLSQLSTALSQVATTVGTSFTGGNTITAAPTTVNGVAGVAVLNLTGAQLQSLNTNGGSGGINLNGTGLLVINIDAANLSLSNNFNALSAGYTGSVLWNFFDATGTISLGTEFGGTVLAPFATINDSSPIDGTVVAKQLNTSGELHSYVLNSTGKTFVSSYGGTPVPEPASLALLTMGLLGLAGARRRRQK